MQGLPGDIEAERKPPIGYIQYRHIPSGSTSLSIVPGAGLEPARPYGQRILSPLRLPFRHPGWNTSELIYSIKRS